MGKPTTYTEDAASTICERLGEGTPLADICRDDDMPAVRTVSDWRKAHPAFDEQFLQARDDGFDAIAADCLRISNSPLEGRQTKLEQVLTNPPSKQLLKLHAEDPETHPLPDLVYELRVVEETRADMIHHRKLQIETRLKLLAKWDPRRYGERLAVDHGAQDSLSDLLRAARERAGKR